MQGTQYATKRSILCRGAFCGPTEQLKLNYLKQPCYLSSTTTTVQHYKKYYKSSQNPIEEIKYYKLSEQLAVGNTKAK